MLTEYLTLFIVLGLPIVFAFIGRKYLHKKIIFKNIFYLKQICSCSFILVLLFFLNSDLYSSTNFTVFGKGVLIPEDIITGLFAAFIVPLIFALLPDKISDKDFTSRIEKFGFPTKFLPEDLKELALFTVYIFTGVIFEELLARKFIFYSLNKTFNITGDWLLIISTIFFSVGHLYQGWKGILSSTLFGLLLGKIYQMEGSIVYPIILHLIFNSTIIALAYKRIMNKAYSN